MVGITVIEVIVVEGCAFCIVFAAAVLLAAWLLLHCGRGWNGVVFSRVGEEVILAAVEIQTTVSAL